MLQGVVRPCLLCAVGSLCASQAGCTTCLLGQQGTMTQPHLTVLPIWFPPIRQVFVKCTGYLLGEYGPLLSAAGEVPLLDQFQLLQERFVAATPETKVGCSQAIPLPCSLAFHAARGSRCVLTSRFTRVHRGSMLTKLNAGPFPAGPAADRLREDAGGGARQCRAARGGGCPAGAVGAKLWEMPA